MTESELEAWLTLCFVPNIGARFAQKLISGCSVEKLISLSERELRLLGLKPEQIKYITSGSKRDVSACLAWSDRTNNHHIMTLLDEDYPPFLKQIHSPPPVLFVRGERSLLSQPQIAIVGSRNASIEGRKNAHDFAADLARNGFTITSGLALGVDGQAHDGALKVKGNTIAVLGSGLDNIYPARHKNLAARIAESGALVSEFWPHGAPKPENFPRRNRIISGLSLGVLVVEAAIKSGSLITAKYALEQGREVFALPSSIHNPCARGGNTLIKQGASLVQSTEEILQELGSLLSWSASRQQSLFITQDEKEPLPFAELLANVEVEKPVSVDILSQRTHIPVHEIMMQLLELELQGHVTAVSGGYIRMRRG